jgi:hypothetical protein
MDYQPFPAKVLAPLHLCADLRTCPSPRDRWCTIFEPELFDAVQAKLAECAVRRKMRRSQSPSLLMGLIFDDRGNPMSPSHARVILQRFANTETAVAWLRSDERQRLVAEVQPMLVVKELVVRLGPVCVNGGDKMCQRAAR